MTGATPDKIALTFTHFGAHNRSDEDSVRVRKRDAMSRKVGTGFPKDMRKEARAHPGSS